MKYLLLQGVLAHISRREHGVGTLALVGYRTCVERYVDPRELEIFRRFSFEFDNFEFSLTERHRYHLVVKEGEDVVIDIPKYVPWEYSLGQFFQVYDKSSVEHGLLHRILIGVDRTFLGGFPTAHYDNWGAYAKWTPEGLEMCTTVGLLKQLTNDDVRQAKLRFK